MVKIEEGKFYRTRDGSRIGPATRIAPRENRDPNFSWRVGPHKYSDDGTASIPWMDPKRERDIIGEDMGAVDSADMGDILAAIACAVHGKGDIRSVTVNGQTWVRQDAPAPEVFELPKWKCHKIVQADRVRGVETRAIDGVELGLVLECGGRVVYDSSSNGLHARIAMMPHSPVGGYYVRYADGYESWSPAKEFEEGYSRMPHGSHDVVHGGGTCTCGVTVEQLEDGVAALECPHRPFKR